MFILLHFAQRCVMTLWIMMVLLLVSFSTQNTIWSVISQHITTTAARCFSNNFDLTLNYLRAPFPYKRK